MVTIYGAFSCAHPNYRFSCAGHPRTSFLNPGSLHCIYSPRHLRRTKYTFNLPNKTTNHGSPAIIQLGLGHRHSRLWRCVILDLICEVCGSPRGKLFLAYLRSSRQPKPAGELASRSPGDLSYSNRARRAWNGAGVAATEQAQQEMNHHQQQAHLTAAHSALQRTTSRTSTRKAEIRNRAAFGRRESNAVLARFSELGARSHDRDSASSAVAPAAEVQQTIEFRQRQSHRATAHSASYRDAPLTTQALALEQRKGQSIELAARSGTTQHAKSALDEQQKRMDIIAHNIANVNTPGYGGGKDKGEKKEKAQDGKKKKI